MCRTDFLEYDRRLVVGNQRLVGSFLPWQVFLDKTWFSPVGKLLSDRDEDLRKKLASVRDDSGELKSLQVSLRAAAAAIDCSIVINDSCYAVHGRPTLPVRDLPVITCKMILMELVLYLFLLFSGL